MAADPSQSRRGTQWLTVGLIATVFACGVAWNRLDSRADAKLDTARFVADSIRRSADNDAMRRDLSDVLGELRETNGRLREIVCAGRAGCR